ncbi:MAG: beta-propeller domain-containing protein, partial [Candidatus Thermoplasmatota archaeon]
DVSKPSTPSELDCEIIEGSNLFTPVLGDHKALLFDYEKNLLVLPVNNYRYSVLKEKGNDFFQGFYVYNFTVEKGFQYRGKITHQSNNFSERHYKGYRDTVFLGRSLYIEDKLYTISNQKIKINSLKNLTEITTINLTEQ